MAEFWIVHRDPHVRDALARLLGGVEALVAPPGDPRLESAPPPRVIVLGVSGDFEAELEFVHRVRARAVSGRWLIVAEPRDRADAARLLGGLGEAVLSWPGGAAELRERLHAALTRREVRSLGERRVRDAVAARFARWFHDLALPEMLLALDPRLVDVPVLIAGEPGTGRSLLARYLHHFGHPEGGDFVDVACLGVENVEALRARLPARARGRWTVCLEDVDALPRALQRELRDWIELGPPAELPPAAAVRWIATRADPIASPPGRAFDPDLAQTLGGIFVRVPPLRERAASIGAIAEETAAVWCRARGERPRSLAPDAIDALRTHPWPGNLRELEAVVVRSLVAEAADPLRAEHLRFDPEAAVARPEEGPGGPEALPEAEDVLGALGAAEIEPIVEAEPLEEAGAGEAVRELEAEPEPAAPMAYSDPTLRRIARAVAHEVRNPLVAIQTLAELLPEHHEDPEFRERFASLVAADTGRIAGVVERLARFAEMPAPRPGRVDVAELLERLLEQCRPRVEQRRLLVLQELDRDEPFAWADPDQIAFAFGALVDRAVELVPERGDLYLASRHHPAAEEGGRPSVRVLLRFQRASGTPGAPVPPELGIEETVLELPVAEAVLRAQGGRITVDTSRADETLVLVELPAPPDAG